MQFAADNVDHDAVTLDGRNTAHMMGIIATVSPSLPQFTRKITRSTLIQTSQLDNISSNLKQHFNSEGAEKLCTVYYKSYFIPDVEVFCT